ncbi:ribonuclease P protein component [Marinobacter caseinilyticus]|uniref:ribonuclease P protein component n=1 Tax=Marinobacter caseinilyticus TaxID=2692195 RepID=UPI00140A0860|nr:ribonuclease P protein component [Marinobacter caseinilyticus]
MGTYVFPRSSRLLTPRDYSEVFGNVQIRVPHKHFLILAAPNTLGHARVGLVFSKKNLKHAVQRNRVKRLVRETFRHRTDLPAIDIVVLGRQGLASVENDALHRMLNDLWERLIRKSARPSPISDTSTAVGKGAG